LLSGLPVTVCCKFGGHAYRDRFFQCFIPREIGNRKVAVHAFAAGLSSAISGIHVGGTEVSPNFARITQMFDLIKGSADHPNRARYDFLTRIDAQTPESAPYVYLVHGIQDGYPDFLPGHRRFTDALRAKNLRYEYHEVPGVHNWVFWDTHIKGVLDRLWVEFGNR
jgi:hypothetical protein